MYNFIHCLYFFKLNHDIMVKKAVIIIFFKDYPVYVKLFDDIFPYVKITGIGIHDFTYLKGIKTLRTHPHYTLHFVIKGKGHYHVNGQKFVISENQIFITPADIMFKYYPHDNQPWTYIWFELMGPKSHIETIFSLLNLSHQKPVYKVQHPHQMIMMFDKLFQYHINQTLFPFTTTITFYQLILLLLEEIHNQPKETLPFVNQALIYIENHYHHPNLKIHDIADYLSISHTYLSQLFKRTLNQTVRSYLIDFRLNRALELMHSPSVTIKAASSMVGYDDEAHFSKAFKKKYGESATSYRRKIYEGTYE